MVEISKSRVGKNTRKAELNVPILSSSVHHQPEPARLGTHHKFLEYSNLVLPKVNWLAKTSESSGVTGMWGIQSSVRTSSPAHLKTKSRIGIASTLSHLRIVNSVHLRIVATLLRSSPSLSVIPFQTPQTFSQLSKPAPLKNAWWIPSVWSIFVLGVFFFSRWL